MGSAPTTDEKADANFNLEDAMRQGDKSKLTVGEARGRWSSGKSLDLFEKGGSDVLAFEQRDWETLPKPMVVDSGAGETVIPSDWLPAHTLHQSVGSKANDYFSAANGARIYNEGEKKLILSNLDRSQMRSMTVQVAKVKKALGSVNSMVRNGNRVVFDLDNLGNDYAYIENKQSKERLWMRAENGVYVLDFLVAPPGYDPNTGQAGGFARPGAPQ